MGKSLIDHVRNRLSFVAFVLLAFAQIASIATVSAEERRLQMYNIHTKKKISIIFKRDGEYDREALKKINKFMGDWRRKTSIKMDPKLVDLIWEIHRELGSKKPVHLISGYRSPKTNAMLRKTRGGQAKKSKHMTGQAADLHFPDIPVKQLRNSALIRQKGGVGYYPTSAIPFVHVDTGRVRHWPRLPRRELAILFPEGKSKHIPSDGKPLKKKDFKIALARLQARGRSLPPAVQRRLNANGSGRTILASLPATPKVPVPSPAPATPDTQKFVLASLNPFEGLSKALPERKPNEAKPLVQTSLQDADKELLGGKLKPNPGAAKPSSLVPQDQIVSAPTPDDDHPDELNYHSFPILPFMTDTPVASMDLHGDPDALKLSKVHYLFGESQNMLHTHFEPGLQFAQLFWSQRFRGTAVNTRIKRLVRNEAPPRPPIQTAQK